MKQILTFIFLVGSFISIAQAATSWQVVCQKEIKDICQPADDLSVYQCLQEATSKISQDCKMMLGDVRQAITKFESTCQNDVTKFCETVTMGSGKRIACLRGKGNAVSSFCRDSLTALTSFGL